MRKIKKILLTLVLLGSSLSASQNIKLMTEIFPPFQYKVEGKLVGLSVEIVAAMQKKMGTKNKLKVFPWTRGVKIVDVKKNTAIFSMLRTKERENKYKWVGPLTSMKLVFFKKKGSPIVLNSIEDAKKVGKIGVAKKVANYEMLTAQGFKNLVVIQRGQDEQNIKLLAHGRIDLWPTLLMAGIYNAKLMGLEDKIEAIENVVAFEGEMYIAFNKQTDDKIIQEWQNTLDALKKDKTVAKIIQSYR